VTQTEALALAHIAAPDTRLWNRQPVAPEDLRPSMIRKNGNRFSEQIVLKPELKR
jgi:hypothetical protein